VTIETFYRIVVTCDGCGKKVKREAGPYPPAGPVPKSWIQTPPPGQREVKEFCSVECLSSWTPPASPWDDDTIEDVSDDDEV
jgi:hypothetical protein